MAKAKKATIQRGGIQAYVAQAMSKFKISAKSTDKSKAKAVAMASKALHDKDESRARRTMNWMLRHETPVSETAARLKAAKTAPRKSSKVRTSARKASAKPPAEQAQATA